MYALVIVVGDLVDRIGPTHALAGGLLLTGISVSCLLWVQSAHSTAWEWWWWRRHDEYEDG